MIKLVFCLRRLPHLSRQEFQGYWRDVHAPLVARHSKALRIQRYVQVHTLDSPLNDTLRESRAARECFDGVAEIWWKDDGDLRAAVESEAGMAAGAELLEDEKRFIDLERSSLWIGEENEVISP
jgi:uncharacterized protein (TIGR02118 family)